MGEQLAVAVAQPCLGGGNVAADAIEQSKLFFKRR